MNGSSPIPLFNQIANSLRCEADQSMAEFLQLEPGNPIVIVEFGAIC